MEPFEGRLEHHGQVIVPLVRGYVRFSPAGGGQPGWEGYFTDPAGDYAIVRALCGGAILVLADGRRGDIHSHPEDERPFAFRGQATAAHD